jgi:hypothetical protein
MLLHHAPRGNSGPIRPLAQVLMSIQSRVSTNRFIMKNKNPKGQAAQQQAKRKVKLTKLKVNKDTIANLSDQESANVKGGSRGIKGTWNFP